MGHRCDESAQPAGATVDITCMLSTCPLRVALWFCGLTRAAVTPEFVAAAARLLAARRERRRC